MKAESENQGVDGEMKKLSCFAILLIAMMFVFVGCDKDQSGVTLENYDEFCGAIEDSERLSSLVQQIVGMGTEKEIALYDPEEGTGIAADDLAGYIDNICDDRLVLEVSGAEGKVSQFRSSSSNVDMSRFKAEKLSFDYKYMMYKEIPSATDPTDPDKNEKEYSGELSSGKFVADGEFVFTRVKNPDGSFIYTISTSGLSLGDKTYRDIYAKYMKDEDGKKSFISARIGGEDINLKLLNLPYQEF